jgi:hypothetical protein
VIYPPLCITALQRSGMTTHALTFMINLALGSAQEVFKAKLPEPSEYRAH